MILIASKCDATFERRAVDPYEIEIQAKRRIKHLNSLQTAIATPETHRRGIVIILKEILAGRIGKDFEPLLGREFPGFIPVSC